MLKTETSSSTPPIESFLQHVQACNGVGRNNMFLLSGKMARVDGFSGKVSQVGPKLYSETSCSDLHRSEDNWPVLAYGVVPRPAIPKTAGFELLIVLYI